MICSCQKEEPTLFVINQTEVTASQIGGLYSISFKSNKSWSAKSSESWCTISPSSGDASIKGAIISMTANDSYDARSSIITITSGGISKTISFTQNAKIALNVTQDKYTLSKEATTIEVEVKANVQFDVIIIGEWITRNTTKSLSQTKLYFNIAKNESYDDRVGSITLKQKEGTFTSTINVLQSQLDAIILTTKSFNLIDTATILSVELSSNVQYVVSIPLVAQSWISQLETKAFIKESLQFRIERNFTNKDRTAQIVVQQPLLKLADTLIIIQDKAPDLPTLTTLDAYDISGYSTKSGGNISKDGGAPILAKGICWYTLENPTIQNFKTDNGLGIGDFTSDIIDLTPATKYYARAYATNRSGTSYGNQIVFITTTTVATPVISPKGKTFTASQIVSITCVTDGAEIRYTLDGSEPKITSALYSGGIPINTETTVKAKAFKKGWLESSVAQETYFINYGATIIEGSSNIVQHIDASNDFIFRLNNLNDKNVFFVLSNKNTGKSVALPTIQSNVVSTSYVEKPMLFSESSFVSSGTLSIHDFSNDPEKYPMSGMSKSQYEQHLASKPDRYTLASSEVLYDYTRVPHLSTVRKVISAHGKNLFVWVADECWGPKSQKRYYVTQEMIDVYAHKFLSPGPDNDIYEWVTNICGAHWGPSDNSNFIPDTDDIHVWLTDIDNDNRVSSPMITGYCNANNTHLKSSYAYSNEKLLIVIDAVLFGQTNNGKWDLSQHMGAISTLAHEFTHMVYNYQKRVLNKQANNTAINEMCAQCVEDLVANKILANGPRGVSYITPNAGGSGNRSGRLPLYNSKNEYTLLDWSSISDQRSLNYSKTYALGAYLMRNYGGANLIKELIQNNSTGVQSVVDAVNTNGGKVASYGDLLERFGAANLLSDYTTMPNGYSYNTGSWVISTVNGIEYQLGSINLYNYSTTPNIYNELPKIQQPGSNTYYRAGNNLNGTQEWSFQGMNSDTKLTVIIR